MEGDDAALAYHGFDVMLHREVAEEWHGLQCYVFREYLVQRLSAVWRRHRKAWKSLARRCPHTSMILLMQAAWQACTKGAPSKHVVSRHLGACAGLSLPYLKLLWSLGKELWFSCARHQSPTRTWPEQDSK